MPGPSQGPLKKGALCDTGQWVLTLRVNVEADHTALPETGQTPRHRRYQQQASISSRAIDWPAAKQALQQPSHHG